MINQYLAEKARQSRKTAHFYEPVFFNLNEKTDSKLLKNLLDNNDNIKVYDEILGQLCELIKSQNPKRLFTREELEEAAHKKLGNTPTEKYGIWVYYPWSNRLVHFLDKEEFIEVRTNRNHYKITPKERTELSTKKIGIIGLSVGQAVALTIAMERICGEIRVADFDVLEATNLNRIRAGVHDLEVPKAIVVAREIAEIDPFLKVVCYTEGLTEGNMDDFFLKGGKLDVCLDECDGLAIKIQCRHKAKELRVPVVMESSDRGTTDIERFDLEPNRSILHGLIDHLDLDKVKEAKTNEEKVPYLLPMLGVETSSDRLKASMLEIEQTITTWPQLASAVAIGGGICTDVCRRILLDQFHDSGRYFLDVEDIIKNKTTDIKNKNIRKQELKPLCKEEMLELIKDADQKIESSQISKHDLNEIVTSALLAPSGGNCQPWKWLFKNNILYLFHDSYNSESLLDYNNSASYIALGTAIENLTLKAAALNYLTTPEWHNNSKKLIASFSFIPNTEQPSDNSLSSLTSFIDKRITNRNLSSRKKIPREKLDSFNSYIKDVPDVSLHIVDNDRAIDKLGNIIAEAEKLRILHKIGHDDFNKEIRWTQKEVEETRDGIDINTIDLSPTELAGLTVSRDWSVVKHLKDWELGNAFSKLAKNAAISTSAYGIITTKGNDRTNYLNAGSAIQRIWLNANKENLAFQPQSTPFFLFARLLYGGGTKLNSSEKEKLSKLLKDFNNLFPSLKNSNKVFIFRLNVAKQPTIKALRKPIEEMLEIVE